MATELGDKLRARRVKLGMTLREVEQLTGIPNAHISQIESGNIRKPDPGILWHLSKAYKLELPQLMRLAGHTVKSAPGNSALLGVAFRAIGELTADEHREVLKYIERIQQDRSTEKPPN